MMLMQARKTAVKVLLVEDDPEYSRLVREILWAAGENRFDLNCVERLSDAAYWLSSHEADVILLDLSLPDVNGIDTVRRMQSFAFNLPVVVLTGYDDEDLALRAMREGAQDYLLKHHLESRLLARVLHYAIERHHAEEALRISEERFRALVQHSSDVIAVLDADGTLLYESPSLERVLGYKPRGIYTLNLVQLVHSEDEQRMAERFAAVMANPEMPVSLETRLRHADGSLLTFEITMTNLLGHAAVRGIVVNAHNISKRKRAEEELRLSLAKAKELNELTARFVSMVAHDFRTPLATILSSSDLLRHYSARMTDEKKQHHFSVIQGQVTHLTGLLDDVLTITKSESVGLAYKPTLTHLGAFCQSIIEELTLVVGNRIQLTVDPKVEATRVDHTLMRRAVLNLLSNAVKYSPEDSPVEVSILRGNGATVLRVRDYGIGIPEEDQSRLFELFHRATNVGDISGTGLGLAIIKRVVDAHGGRIGVDSRVGEGTTFTITIPSG